MWVEFLVMSVSVFTIGVCGTLLFQRYREHQARYVRLLSRLASIEARLSMLEK